MQGEVNKINRILKKHPEDLNNSILYLDFLILCYGVDYVRFDINTGYRFIGLVRRPALSVEHGEINTRWPSLQLSALGKPDKNSECLQSLSCNFE